MIWDAHMHCHFSGDSETPPVDMINASIVKGLPGICFTDHLDYDFKEQPGLFDLDLEPYYHTITQLQQEYKDQINIHYGIELGLQPHIVSKNLAVIKQYPFDFVIGSTHLVNGIDPYYPQYFSNRTEEEGYLEYFETTLMNIKSSPDYDVYGHIDYIVRYGPNKNKFYTYKKYQDIIDEILRRLIEGGKGIEINTAGFKYGLGHPNPTEEILTRYKELGGEIITVGSDAHVPEHVAYDFSKVPDILKAAGFNYYTVFEKRKPVFMKI